MVYSKLNKNIILLSRDFCQDYYNINISIQKME